jgi:alpha-ketoglutarate-dependent taurine dioxygenase
MVSAVYFGQESVNRGGPFDLYDVPSYERWRALKLADYPSRLNDLIVRIKDPTRLSGQEHKAVLVRCRKANLVIYELTTAKPAEKAQVRLLGQQFGLRHLDSNLCADNDSITSLCVMKAGRHKDYIPYTNRGLNWHTDGYYNEPDFPIRSIHMHCVQDAASGGENGLFDHEIAYILMRDEDPELVSAFMQPDAMTIPANVENGVEVRSAQTGPVFGVDPLTGNLFMRYTARTRNILWKRDPATQAAVRFMQALLAGTSRYLFRHRLQPAQGVLCNNVLHSRSAFCDDETSGQRRLIYRARYHDRIAGTEFYEIHR